MNCANHPDRERTAFCQNCGKPLCSECIRNLGPSIYCEPCYVARTNPAAPPTGFPYPGYPNPGYPGSPAGTPPPTSGIPNPGLAALLGFIPGVGAMYNEQYGKGIVHLIVFAVLVSLTDHVNGIFGLFIAGWIFYMVIEAHHTARARRDGTPLPNPFGLNDIAERMGFGKAWPNAPYTATPGPDQPANQGTPPAAGQSSSGPPSNPYSYSYTPPVSQWAAAPQPPYNYGMPPTPPVPPTPPEPNLERHRHIPTGAIWLIGLGVLFLFGNAGIFHIFPGKLFAPFLLIGVGVWVFVSRMTSTGQGLENDGTPYYHWRLTRAINSAMWIVLTGVLLLLAELHIFPWSHSWPLYMIAGGLVLMLKRSGYGSYPGTPAPPSAPAVSSTEIVPADPTHDPANPQGHDQEGR